MKNTRACSAWINTKNDSNSCITPRITQVLSLITLEQKFNIAGVIESESHEFEENVYFSAFSISIYQRERAT